MFRQNWEKEQKIHKPQLGFHPYGPLHGLWSHVRFLGVNKNPDGKQKSLGGGGSSVTC